MKQHVNVFQNRNENVPQVQTVELPDFYLDDELLEELKEFCQSFNPYEEMDLETKLRLQAYGVTDFANPFAMTNTILLLLENNLQYREKINDLQS